MKASLMFRFQACLFRFSAGMLLAPLLFLVTPLDGKCAVPTGKTQALAAADNAFMSLNYSAADSLYKAMLVTCPENADLYWKLARLNISIAESINPDDSAKRMPYYTKAVDYAQKAVAIDSTNASCHTWYAAALAVKADKTGAKEKVRRAAEIKRELDKALALNPHDDVAWSILGSYHHQISNIGWFSRLVGSTFIGGMPEGNRKAAEHAFKKAISLNPRAIRHFYELALLYMDEGRKEEALQILQAASKKPVLMKGDVRRLEEIHELIRKLSTTENAPPTIDGSGSL
jgi:tetratricopeptide (TPR) repeat protein